MASPGRQATILIFSLAYLCVLISSSSASDPNKVSLALYYESLCPYSANFIVNYLNDVVQDTHLLSIIDLYLSPWGNAKIKPNDTFSCQHGPYECLLNTVEACAIHVWPKLEVHFPFINCIESLVLKRSYSEWDTCFQKLGLDPKPLVDCYKSGKGKKLELQYAAETTALQPPHEYVPWVVVDGKPLYEEYEDFISYICKAYKGTAAPKACSGLSHHRRQRTRTNKIVPVCYNKEAKIWVLGDRIRSVVSKWMQQIKWVASV